jgi:hypothetical protein
MPKNAATEKFKRFHFNAGADAVQFVIGLLITVIGATALWGWAGGCIAGGLLAQADIWIDGIMLALAERKP